MHAWSHQRALEEGGQDHKELMQQEIFWEAMYKALELKKCQRVLETNTHQGRGKNAPRKDNRGRGMEQYPSPFLL